MSKSSEPSKEFLQLAELYLTGYKSDPSHHPSVKSSLIRIPGSYNFKCVQRNNDVADSTTKVKIIQKWDGFRPKANPLYYHFYIYLADRKLKELNNMQKAQTESQRRNTIAWIEKLLQTPIDDFRKNVINLILAPYLINVKKVSYYTASNIINDWLVKCGKLRQLDQNFDYTVRYALKYSAKNGQRPLKLDTLKLRNQTVHDMLK